MLLDKMEYQRRRRFTEKVVFETRKCREQTGLDTLVVYTVNYECEMVFCQKELETFRLNSTIARLKSKKFGGSLFQLEERVV